METGESMAPSPLYIRLGQSPTPVVAFLFELLRDVCGRHDVYAALNDVLYGLILGPGVVGSCLLVPCPHLLGGVKDIGSESNHEATANLTEDVTFNPCMSK
ncbi:hypothetical protein E2C01_041032 [Portunus trituberculatus]|uniref:Uncharacterized protein n=1 Tax=Portunus trituberculatus TaxID=210409 RepID=A0A5B7FI49_PORTR|nr:hypothetical protein [Portunus trituberculatus]